MTNLCLFLKIEGVDFLQLTLQTEEEGGFVGLQRCLRLLELVIVGRKLAGGDDGRGAQFLDELWG